MLDEGGVEVVDCADECCEAGYYLRGWVSESARLARCVEFLIEKGRSCVAVRELRGHLKGEQGVRGSS